MDITTIILTYNEEKNIAAAIESIKKLSKDIYVIDSFSTDNTVNIAQDLGAKVITHPFVNQAQQFQYALDTIKFNTEWVLRLDADERISKAASIEIEEKLNTIDLSVNGIIVPFEVTFLGKKLRHGGIFPFKKMILFRHKKAIMEQRNMDEHMVLREGKVISLKSISEHEDYKDLSTWIDKHNKYSSREVLDYLDAKNNLSKVIQLNKTAKMRRFMKYKVYYKMPMSLRAFLYFVYRYILMGGFLDGKPGFIFAVLQAFWYRFLVDAKIYESKRKNNYV